MVNPQFEKWAQEFSGCDEGNPNGKIWLCGLEFGGGETERSFRFEDLTKPTFVGEATWGKDWPQTFLKHPYNLRAVKLLQSFSGKHALDIVECFRQEDCFGQESNYFKLNLYPIAFRDTSDAHWNDWIGQITGIESKSEYIAWCRVNRFPVLRQWVHEVLPHRIPAIRSAAPKM